MKKYVIGCKRTKSGYSIEIDMLGLAIDVINTNIRKISSFLRGNTSA